MGGFKNVLKCLIFIELTNLFSLNVNAQNISDSFQLVGVVKDSISEKGISYVTITVQNEKGMVKCLASDSLGKFDFTLNLSGKNDIIFHSVGYQLRKIPLLYEGKNKKVDLGTILLSAANEKIGEVTIVVQKPLVRIEIDKIVYSMETDPESKTNNVIEMLRKVPLISVDGEDNIQVKGSTNFKILVNGKSSSMISQNYKDVLRSMPASTVREIEVITDPSSKYEAEGTAGIINIITMRKKSDGFTVKLNTRADSRGGYSAGLYSAAKINNFGFSLNYNYNKWKQPQTESYSTRENFLSSTNYYTKSEGTGKYNGVYNYLASEASYEIDTLRLISLSFMGYFGKFYGDGETMTWNFDQNMNVTRQFENLSNYIGRYRYFSGNIDYQRTFMKPDKTFTVSYKLEDFTRNIDNQNEILGLINYNSYHQKTSNIPTGREHTFQLDYFDPLSKTHQVETGVKYILRQNISNSGVFMYDSTINANQELNC